MNAFHELMILYFRSIMQLFYSNNISKSQCTLTEDEHIHLSKTLRKKVGDTIHIMNGLGSIYACEITKISKRESELSVRSEKQHSPQGVSIEVALAPTKNISRYEWFLEKATELGITHITPIITRYSERERLRMDRCQKILIAAMKQSMNPYLPILNPMITFAEYLSRCEATQRYIAYVPEDQSTLRQQLTKGTDCSICIGPEGGFEPKEIELAAQHKFKAVSLGNSRLRTETAGVIASHIAVMINND